MIIQLGLYLGLLLSSFIITSISIVPFIDLLFRLKFTHHHLLEATFKEESKVFSKLHLFQKTKLGTPIGGGILIILIVTVLYAISYLVLSQLGIAVSRLYSFIEELNILFFTFISFALLGLYDDILKIFNLTQTQNAVKPLRKNVMIIILSGLVSLMLFLNLHIDIIYFPIFGALDLNWVFVPVVTLIISFFSKAFDITDGMDGLAGGVLLVALISFWAISLSSLDSIISIFIALWIGSLLAFMYFNVYPARIWLGNAGSLSFGATLAVIGILLGKTSALLIIGVVFVIEAGMQLLQVISVSLRKKPLFLVTPIHYWLQNRGWPEPKIVMRLWIITLMAAIFGLWLAEI